MTPHDFDDLRREGPIPAIVPNFGHRREICWTRADLGRFGDALRRAFPDAFFYEHFESGDETCPKPSPLVPERLDDPRIVNSIHVLFPYPGWKPKLVLATYDPGRVKPYWTWSHYVSPILTINNGLRGSGALNIDASAPDTWIDEAADSPIETWRLSSVTTSYRRELPEERRIQARALRILERMCVRTVPVRWDTYADFQARKGRVRKSGFLAGCGWVTPAVLDWYRAAPRRAIDLGLFMQGSADSCLPVDEVPDSWWGDVRKPKWAQVGG